MISRFLLLILVLSGITLNAKIVTLTWQDAVNPTGTNYSVYRSNSSCSTSTLFVKIANSVAEKTYDNLDVGPGTYCYRVTATFNGIESIPSNLAEAIIPLSPPAALTVTVK